MKNISKKETGFHCTAGSFCNNRTGMAGPLQRTAGVRIGFSVGSSQGAAENNTEMESIKVNGTFWNEGDIIAKNLTAIVIFTDDAHNKVVRKRSKKELICPRTKANSRILFRIFKREDHTENIRKRYFSVRLYGKRAFKNNER